MDIIQLRYFLKTAETMNYTKAAEALFTSRQALRHTLDTLEKELGQDLFETDHNRLPSPSTANTLLWPAPARSRLLTPWRPM